MTHKQLNTFWILTLLVAPNIYAIYFLLGYETDLIFKDLGLVPFLLVYSIILSLPALVLDHLIIWTFRRISQPKKIDSYIILCSTITCILLCFYLLIGNFLSNPLVYIYIGSALITFISIKIYWYLKNKKLPTTQG